jgi:hypothetical protein
MIAVMTYLDEDRTWRGDGKGSEWHDVEKKTAFVVVRVRVTVREVVKCAQTRP